MKSFGIKHSVTSPYHPQSNGQLDSTNKVLESILNKVVVYHRKNWAKNIPKSLWAYRKTWQNKTTFSPYDYGKSPFFQVKLEIKILRTTLDVGLDHSEAHKHRLEQLNEFDAIHLVVFQNIAINYQQQTKWHDKFLKKKVFQRGDWSFIYDSQFKYFKGKLCSRWMHTQEFDTMFDNGSARLVIIDQVHTPLISNGNHLILYHHLVFKDSFY